MSRVFAGHIEAFANYNLQGVQDHPKAQSRKQTSMSKKFEAASQFENYSARMCARGLLHRQNYSLSFSSFATNKETPSLQWQCNQSTQRVMPTKTAPLAARTCTCSWKVLACKTCKKTWTWFTWPQDSGISVWKLQCSHVQKRTPASTKLLSFILILRHQYRNNSQHWWSNQSTKPVMQCQLKQWQKRQEPVLRHGEPWPCKICKQTWTTWNTCPENSCQRHLSLKTILLASARDILCIDKTTLWKLSSCAKHFILHAETVSQ